jgi:hypothetical protein
MYSDFIRLDFIFRSGDERVSAATSPIDYGSKPFEPAVSRATSPMDNKVLKDIFGSSDYEYLPTGINKNLEAGKRVQEDDTTKQRQVLNTVLL